MRKEVQMETKPLRNLAELQAEIALLKTELQIRETDLKEHVNQYVSLVETPLKWLAYLKNVFADSNKNKTDLLSSIAQFGIPILLNSVLFKKSGLLVKGLIAFVGQQLAKGITVAHVSSWMEQLSAWFKKMDVERSEIDEDSEKPKS